MSNTYSIVYREYPKFFSIIPSLVQSALIPCEILNYSYSQKNQEILQNIYLASSDLGKDNS